MLGKCSNNNSREAWYPCTSIGYIEWDNGDVIPHYIFIYENVLVGYEVEGLMWEKTQEVENYAKRELMRREKRGEIAKNVG